jgi:two-component system, OmpR family, sensor histidine kinase KdpD
VAFAHAQSASRLVIGASRRSRLAELTGGSIVRDVIRSAGQLEVHVISDAPTLVPGGTATSTGRTAARSWTPRIALSRRRVALGIVVAFVGLLAVTVSASTVGLDLSVALSLYLLTVVSSAAVGGWVPAFVSAIAAPFLANWFLVEPLHTLEIDDANSLVELAVFMAVALITSTVVSIGARRASEAEVLSADARLLTDLASSRTGDGLTDLARLTEELRKALDLDRLELQATGSGPIPTGDAENSTVRIAVDADFELVGGGRQLDTRSQSLLPVFVSQLRAVLSNVRAQEIERETQSLREADALKLSLLQTVSHDLRTPLAGIKAAASSLRATDIEWSPEDSNDFLQTIEDNSDRLSTMVTNLLDFSRLQSGTLRPALRSASLEEVVPAALASLGSRAHDVMLALPADLPDVVTDPPLLERVVANVVANAITWSPPGSPVLVCASFVRDKVRVQVIDRGPGIGPKDRERALEPFERVAGTSVTGHPTSPGGVGLGLAIAGGLTRAVGGTLQLRDTPGGGLTAELTLPRAPEAKP